MKQEYIHPLTDAVFIETARIICVSNESIQPGEDIDWAPRRDDY